MNNHTLGLTQLSEENAKTVRTLTPHLQQSSIKTLKARIPAS